MLGVQIGSIRLDARVGRRPILLGRERMNHARFKSGFGKSPFGSQMVVSRSFHDDDHVLDVVFLLSFSNLGYGQLEEGRIMLQRLLFDE